MLQSLALMVDDSPLNLWIADTFWLWPVLEICHFIGFSLLFGGLIIIDLRLAGFVKSLSPVAIHKLLPAVLIGFAINLTSGILFFYGDPMRYAINIGFQIKMGLVLLAGVNAAFYYWKIHPGMHAWAMDADSPPIAKFVAYASMATWTSVLLCGRLIPYVGTG